MSTTMNTETVSKRTQIEPVVSNPIDGDTPYATVDAHHIPRDLEAIGDDTPMFALWDGEKKLARAPWARNGYAGKCTWAEKDIQTGDITDPRADLDTVLYAVEPELALTYRWHGDDETGHLQPCVLAPPRDRQPSPGWLFIDLDDVRDPVTGRIPVKVRDLIRELDAYTEVSTSGTGLHVFVRLEGGLPDDRGHFIAELDDIEPVVDGNTPQVEMYPNHRVAGVTFDHVAGTPFNRVPDRTETVHEIVDAYEHAETRGRETRDVDEDDLFERVHREMTGNHGGGSGGSNHCDYFDLDAQHVARHYGFDPASGNQGPHPEHGATTSKETGERSTNFKADSEGWFCFAHWNGGAALELVGVCEGVFDCHDVPEKGGGFVTDDDNRLLRTCVAARDAGLVSRDADPPYAALLALARRMNLIEAGDDELSRVDRNLVRATYGEIGLAELRGDQS